MPIVKPISDIQRNINAITEECAQTRQPIYLTKNGNKSLVVMDADAFDEEMALHAEVYDREMRVIKPSRVATRTCLPVGSHQQTKRWPERAFAATPRKADEACSREFRKARQWLIER